MRHEVTVTYAFRVQNVEADSVKEAEMQVHGALKMFSAQMVMAFGAITLLLSDGKGCSVVASVEQPPFYERQWTLKKVEDAHET